jgi:DNA-binding response OmpR family regulator
MDKDGIAIDLNSGNALEVFRNLQHEDHVPRFLPALRRQPLRQTSVMQFGTYEVSLQSGEVRKAGVKIRVQQQPMKLLKILQERPGEVVTMEELRGRVWEKDAMLRRIISPLGHQAKHFESLDYACNLIC